MITITSQNWASFKAIVITAKQLQLQFEETAFCYNIYAFDDASLCWSYTIAKDSGSDQIDFETNYKSKGNGKLAGQTDSDNASFSRTKQAPTGWTYQFRGIEFVTSNPSSLVNLDPNGNTLTDANIKLYDASGVLTTTSSLAVKTVIDFEPAYDYYVIGGLSKIQVTPVNDVRLSVIAVPDVPFAYGGSRIMIQNVNFKFITSLDKIDADGRASKMLSYSATNHTSKLRFIVTHLAGETHSIAIYLEHYKI